MCASGTLELSYRDETYGTVHGRAGSFDYELSGGAA